MATGQTPAVVIVARHGMRLDAADQSWHLSTPTPYDPPLTYGGWNQCRALGVRVASLIQQREDAVNNLPPENGRRKKRKHKVVIHTSPFLRCLQTSVAISAGMAQFETPNGRPSSSKNRTPAQLHSGVHSPRLHGLSGSASPSLAPIAEPRHDLAHQLARRTLGEHKRYRKSKIRVDAFLGEWLNPQYFDQITPPPPSPMMVAGAKAELMSNDTVDIFTPALSHKSSNNSLWSGGNRASASRESTLDDWSHVAEALRAPSLRRERSNSASSVGSNDSARSSGHKSPFRPGHILQPMTSTIPKPEYSVYRPPSPSYAISNSDHIPRGYVTHARNATVNVDYSWDSSRPPLNFGGGGEFGEEWSSMHKRFRRGFNNLIEWYSQHNADDRGEDALGFEQAERPHIHRDDDEEQEDLVVILVTHGAGSNALIGALTGQPVLLDVGMASLTMATRKEDAPPLLYFLPSPDGTPSQSPDPAQMNGHKRRSSVDIGLSAIYEMKLVSSSEHLRPGADLTKPAVSSVPANMRAGQEALSRYKKFGAEAHGAPGAGIESLWHLGEPKRSNTSSALGSVRRPNYPITSTRGSSIDRQSATPPPSFSTGLWTPPSGKGTPQLTAQKIKEEKDALFSKLNQRDGRQSPGRDMMLDFSNSPPDSRPTSSNEAAAPLAGSPSIDETIDSNSKKVDSVTGETAEIADELADLPKVDKEASSSLSRGLSQKGLWGRQTNGDTVIRQWKTEPKRRWTVNEND